MKIRARIVARDADGTLIGSEDVPDIGVKALAQLMQTNIFNTTQTIADTTNTGRSVTANSASTIPTIVAGTIGTAPAFTDFALGAIATGGGYNTSNTSGSQAATINAISGTSWTATATITNISGGTITYKEVGMSVTVGGNTFLLTHDQVNSGTGFPVSNNGTLATTYTFNYT